MDHDRPKATDTEVQAAITTVEAVLEGRVPVAYTVTDGRKAAQLAGRQPAANTEALDRAHYQHQRQQTTGN
ncbi:MAG: hypothetical protein OXD37_10595 [Acidimicrobiaceae bacterium]|nr:hypothetical protein [Acidimicrobiaceae bacterium]